MFPPQLPPQAAHSMPPPLSGKEPTSDIPPPISSTTHLKSMSPCNGLFHPGGKKSLTVYSIYSPDHLINLSPLILLRSNEKHRGVWEETGAPTQRERANSTQTLTQGRGIEPGSLGAVRQQC